MFNFHCSRYDFKIFAKKKVRNKRRWWVRPLLRNREKRSQYYNLFQYIKEKDDEQFFKFTRMTVNQFEKLLDLVKDRLIKISPRKPLSPEFRLVMTL